MVRVVGGDENETGTTGLPCECSNSVFDFDDLNGTVLVPETEQFEIAVLCLLGLGVTVNLDAKIVSL